MKKVLALFLALFLVIGCLPLSTFATELSTGGTLPASPSLYFTDSAETEYVDGAVLHYVDFTKTSTLEEIGYYANGTAETLETTGEGLHIVSKGNVYLTPFGAKVPKNIPSFTVEMTLTFNDSVNNNFLIFYPAANSTGDGPRSGDVALRSNPGWGENGPFLHDNAWNPIQGTKADAYRLTQDLKSGKEVTFAFHIVENAMTSLTATCNGTTVVLNGNTAKSVLGYNWGFVVGTNSNVTVKSVAMMAGGNWQTGKVWPTGYTTGENILDVPKSAFKTAKDIDLDPNRTVPTASELSFDDTADTQYVPGAVLHHVDFGKVNSLKEVGYYVTGDPSTYEITEDGLHVVTTTSSKLYITPFGASIPRNIQDYTLRVTFKANPQVTSAKYLVFNPGVNEAGNGNSGGDMAFRPYSSSVWGEKGPFLHDNGWPRNGSTNQDCYALEQEMAKGHDVTISIPVQGGKTLLSNDIYLKAECNGKVCYVRATTLTVTNWGFTLGNGPDDMTIRSITMVAGCDVDQDLIWPAGAGEQVLNVPQTAIRPNGTVTIGGEIPTAPEMPFDSKDTEYVDGTVLHYVDFSTVDDLSAIGYYVGGNGVTNENSTLMLTDEGLYVKTTDKKVYVTPFGAEIPRNLDDYTVCVEMKFLNGAGKYLVFNPSVNETGTGVVSGDCAIRPSGPYGWASENLYLHDMGKVQAGTSRTDAAAVQSALKNGQWAKVSFAIRNNCLVSVKAEAVGKTIYLEGNFAKAVYDSVWGLMVGAGKDEMYIKSVAMIAGSDLTHTFTAPSGNVLQVPESAIAKSTQELKVLTYNIRQSGMLYGYNYTELAKDLIATGADIIGLEEVFDKAERNFYQDTMKLLGEQMGYYYYFGSYEEFEGGYYGDGFLSKYPIVGEPEIFDLRAAGVTDGEGVGGLIKAKINVNGVILNFYVTHFYKQNVTPALQYIYNIVGETDPFILVGDFNSQDFDAFNTVFSGCTVANQGTVTTIDDSMVDNLVLSPSVSLVEGSFEVTPTMKSDHYPCTVRVKIPASEYTELTVSGDYKTEYNFGEALDLTGISVKLGEVDVALRDVIISGYSNTTVGTQTITLTYGTASATIQVTVRSVRSIVSIIKTASNGSTDTYTITYSDGTTETFTLTNGTDGADGADGKPGVDGKTPTFKVENGILYVRYEETEEWTSLGSLKGADGVAGVGIEKVEKTGSNGNVDTYTITLTDRSTFTFTVSNGTNGKDGADGANGKDGADGRNGVDGKDGTDGKNGADGKNGKDGATPKLRINAETNEWEVSYDNGTTWTSLGVKATGENGQNGITPQLRINSATNEWEVSYDDGATWTSLGVKATGENGKDGMAVAAIAMSGVSLVGMIAMAAWMLRKKTK